jgi:Ca-activated chloride channel family protein
MNTSFWQAVHFHRPSIIFLTLLVLVPLIWWRWLRRDRHQAIRFSSLDHLRSLGTTLNVRARHILPALRTLAVILLIICLARPQKGDEETRITSEGIAIQLLIDRSSSMMARDFTLNGEPTDRLAVVKSVAEDFVVGDPDEDLTGRPDDLIGMIAFAGYADSKCPLTLDHGYLIDTLRNTEIVDPIKLRDDDGTAIGDAIALGVERMRDLAERREALKANRIKSKILVLLTDGDQTRGDLTPQQGAEIAKALGIKIYTIGVGTRGYAPMPVPDPFGRTVLRSVPVHIDEDTLKEIAKTTGGEYFRATDTDSLRKIYARINELEKTKTEEKRYLQNAELATQVLHVGRIPIPPLLLIVVGLLTLEVILANTRLRKAP